MKTVIAQELGRLKPGQVTRGLLRPGSLASGNSIGVPYLIAKGHGNGPCLWINATVHGDESQASITASEFFNAVRQEKLAGNVVVTPVANPLAFDNRSKNSPFDGVDLDQSFPGRSEFLGTQRLASRLFEEMSVLADVLVNIHTMGPFLDACNYAVYKVLPDVADELDQLSLIALLEPRVACRMDVGGAGELPGNIAGALDYQLMRLGKQAFMLEVGAGGRLDRAAVDKAIAGLLRLARATGTTVGTPPDVPGSICRVTRRTHVTCAEGGFFHALAAPGQVVPAAGSLGEVYNVYGDLIETVTLPVPVTVIGLRRDPVVHTGDRVAFVATEWSDVELPRPVVGMP